MIAKLGRWRQRGDFPGAGGVIERAQLVEQHTNRPTVNDNVVGGHDQQMFGGGYFEQRHPEERPRGQIQRATTLLRQPGCDLFTLRCAGVVAVINHGQIDGQRGQYFLGIAGCANAGAQGFMAFDQPLYRPL